MAARGAGPEDAAERGAERRGPSGPRGSGLSAAALVLARRLREALHRRQAGEVESLLRCGADPNLVLPDGVAAIHLAAGSEQEDGLQCLVVLLQHGADPNARSEDALTPVHVAASWGCYKCLKILLKEGGDPELQDQDGKRALDLALEEGNIECVEILKKLANPKEVLPCRSLGRREDQGNSLFSALNGDDLDTSIWGFSDVTFSQGPLGSILESHLEDIEVENVALGADHTLPSQTLPAHLQSLKNKELGVEQLSESDLNSSVSCSGQDSISPDLSFPLHPDPDQGEIVFLSLLEETHSSSSDSFFTAVEACGPEDQMFGPVCSTPLTLDASGAMPSQPGMNRSGSQLGSTSGTNLTQIVPLDVCCPDSRAPQTSGPPGKLLAYETLKAEHRTMTLNATESTLDESDMLPSMDPVIHLNAQLGELVLDSPSESQDLVITGIPQKFQGLVSHVGDGNNSLSDGCVEQSPLPQVLPDGYNPGFMSNESLKEGDCLTVEEARAVLTTQTGNSGAFTDDIPFNDFLTEDQTSLESEGRASMWLTEDGEEEKDHVPPGLRDNSCQNGVRKPLEKPRACPVQNPQQYPLEKSLQPSGPKPTGYLHTDPKARSSFLDPQPLPAEDPVTDEQCSSHPSIPVPSQDPSTLSNQELLKLLRALRENPSPVTTFTRQYYLRLLKERTPGRSSVFSPELTLALQTGCVPNAQDDEDVLAQQFDQPDQTQRWREGIVKSSFTYLLLDPRVTQNLPSRCHLLSPAECFQTFTRAIFYVGKGTRARPYSHLSEALSHQRNRQKKQTCLKVQRILDIWAGGHGVVSLHCFQNVIAVEAYTREACLVDALGMQVLSNQKKGHYYGVVASWPLHRRRRLGVHLLHRALGIFLAEGERQLRPPDIQVGT